MDALDELLGQRALADKIAEKLIVPGARVWLKGPPGSGKSTIAKLVTDRLRKVGTAIHLIGDVAQTGTRFLAAHRALSGTRSSRPVREALPSVLLSPARLVPYANVLPDWVRLVTLYSQRKRPEFLNGEQLDILDGFQRLAGGQRAFVVVDDVGWLDPETTQLLSVVSRPEVIQAFPFAEGLSILLVENVEVSPRSNGEALDALRHGEVLSCGAVTRGDFGRVLETLGMTKRMDVQLLDDLYAISRGHLEIAKQIMKLDQGADLASLLARGDATSLMAELLDKRLNTLGGADALLRLLSLAACAGSVFSEAELRCAYVDPDAFSIALQAARREDLIVSDEGSLRFVHDVVRAAAARLGTAQASELHSRLAECVKRIRPGDYPGRLRHLRLAGASERTEEVAFAVAMQAIRGDGPDADPVRDEVGAFQNVLAALRESYRLMDAGDHRRAIALAMPHYDGSASLVQGEVVLLLALNHIKRRTSDAYAVAAALLESWKERRKEPELWERLMSVLTVAWANAGEIDRAGSLYAVLKATLDARARTDEAARTRLEALNRKADMFLASEIAQRHIQGAASWFGPRDDGGLPRNGFEYTASEINLSGTLFTCGRFEAAVESATRAMAAIERLQARRLRSAEPYKALNNYAIASFRAGSESARSLSTALDLITPSGRGVYLGDRSLLACNRAIFAILDGRVDEATASLRDVWETVRAEDADRYYTLYAGSNLAVASALAGDRARARELLAQVEPCLDAMPKWVRQAHRRRHAMMSAAVADSSLATPSDFDEFPMQERSPDGDQDVWWSIGRGLLMSDIQVWSEG